jgi:hypothetical protein
LQHRLLLLRCGRVEKALGVKSFNFTEFQQSQEHCMPPWQGLESLQLKVLRISVMDVVSKVIVIIVIIRRSRGLHSTNFVIDWDVRGQPPPKPPPTDHCLQVLC